MKKLLLVFVFSLLFFSIFAQDFEERLRRNLASRADAIFRRFTSTTPGCSAGAFYNHKTVFSKAYGNKRLNPNQRFTPETLTRVASTSKQFTAMLIAILIEDGKLNEEDDVRKYLPRLPSTWSAVVRLKHMIHMTSGIFDYDDFIDVEKGVDDREVIWRIIAQRGGRLRFTPGSKEEYCNTNYFLLSEIVEKVTGKRFREYAHQEIFGKLGMEAYFEDGTVPRNPDVARGYTKKNGVWRETMPTYMTVGDSGLKINVPDWLLYDTAYYFPDKIRHGKKVMERIIKPGVLNNGARINYAYGLELGTRNRVRFQEHDGYYYGYVAQYTRYPDDKYSVICMCNDGTDADTEEYCLALRKIFDDSKSQPMWEVGVYGAFFVVLSFVGLFAFKYIKH